jgi:uncharacterized protein YbaP (TraB family)
MKKLSKLISLLLCAALLLSLVGCTAKPAETTTPTTQPPTSAPTEPAADELYAQARKALDEMTDISLALVITTSLRIGDDEFSEESTQVLTYKGIGTEDPVICMDESELFSIHAPGERENDVPQVYREIWSQGTLFTDTENLYRFSGPMDAETAATRYTPVVLLNAELYGSLTSTDSTLIFEQPTAAESWALPQGAEMLDAAGTVAITPDGQLREMTYTITYTYGPAEITKTVVSSPMDTVRNIAHPATPDSYTHLTDIESVQLYLQGVSMLAQTDSLTASGLESMFCQAAGYLRNQSTVVNLHGRQDSTKAKIETSLFARDYGNNETEEYELEEVFKNGKYTSIVNKGLPTSRSDITWGDVREYTGGIMVAGLLNPEDWKDTTVTDLGSVFMIEYQLTEDFGNRTQNSICQMLWNDPSFLYNLADKYENAELTGYLSIDKFTGIPVAAGYYYEGIHTIEGTDYPLTFQFDQSIEAPAKGAYYEITEQMPEEAEPETKPTPLFYHVTGENGQEMWLFGTIHVGDERTNFLPEEIYNAFSSSDALALEINSKAFDKQLEEDDDLSSQVSNYYYFSDGTTIESLMEEEEYAQAVKLMKATGNYNMNMPYAKPYLWSNGIEQFYLRQGYALHGDQGVEERLHIWAEELDKEIREVESSIFQIKLLTGYSNELQMLMLRDALETTVEDYNGGVLELYELWCAGDEAALIEAINEEVDTSELTEEELAEYEAQKPLIDEYNKGLSYDRNIGMLKTAIEYLESGEVIFYAVGLAHLLDSTNGLVQALRDAGYTVELVPYA